MYRLGRGRARESPESATKWWNFYIWLARNWCSLSFSWRVWVSLFKLLLVVQSTDDNGSRFTMWKYKKIELPSGRMFAARHLEKRHAWHWFRRDTSTIHLPPSLHVYSKFLWKKMKTKLGRWTVSLIISNPDCFVSIFNRLPFTYLRMLRLKKPRHPSHDGTP